MSGLGRTPARWLTWLVFVTASQGPAAGPLPKPGGVDSSFNPATGFEGWQAAAECIVPQADGKILLGGSFTLGAGVPRQGLARLNPDGTLDAGFDARLLQANDAANPAVGIGAIAVQPDGKILLGGWFTRVGDLAQTNLARVGTDGHPDPSFAPYLGNAGSACAIVVQPDGRILIGGNFEQVNQVRQPYLARLHPDGRLDSSFQPAPLEIGDDWYVTALGLQSDGKVLVAGHLFDRPWETYLGLVRLHPDGRLDTEFRTQVRADYVVFDLYVLPDDRILIDSGVTAYGRQARGPARLNADGSLDTSFRPPDVGWIETMAPAPDGRVVIGGFDYLLQLEPDGRVNPRFETTITGGADNRVWCAAVQPDGQILIEGDFTHVNGEAVPGLARLQGDRTPVAPTAGDPLTAQSRFVGGAATFTTSVAGTGPMTYQWLFDGHPIEGAVGATLILENLAPAHAGAYAVVVSNALGFCIDGPALLEVNPVPAGPGSLDVRFDLTAGGRRVGLEGHSGAVLALAAQPNGQVVVGGSFVGLNGVPCYNLARLDPRGGVDPTFRSVGTDQAVEAIAVQTNGGVLLGGSFHRVNGRSRPHLARLSPRGHLDASFVPALGEAEADTVAVIAVQPDQAILVGGALRGPLPSAVSIPLLRLHPDGTLDTGFRAPVLTNAVRQCRALALAPDGKILVGYSVEPGAQPLERLNPDGTVDSTFAPAMESLGSSSPEVTAIAVLADRRIVIGGEFAVADEGGARALRLARLHPDGRLDATLAADFEVSTVCTFAVQPDGKLVVGGAFVDPRRGTLNLIRLDATGEPDPTFQDYQPGSWANGLVRTVLVLSDARLVVGRDFDGGTSWDEGLVYFTDPGGVTTQGVRSHRQGAEVEAIAPQRNGQILIGGRFAALHGVDRPHLARLESDGTLDFGFLPELEFGPDSGVRAIHTQSDGRILVGGDRFFAIGALRWAHLIRLEPNGRVENAFQAAAPDDDVLTLATQPDGRILAGGWFKAPRPALVRYLPEGTLDPDFQCLLEGEDCHVAALVLLSDGRLLAGGEFSRCNGVQRAGLAMLTPTGALDSSFVPAPSLGFQVGGMARDPDGRWLIGGRVTDHHTGDQRCLVRLQADGRLDPSLDTAWLADAWLDSVVVQLDGSLIIGGSVRGGPGPAGEPKVFRLRPDGSRDDSFVAEGAAAPLAQSPDGGLLATAPMHFVNGLPCGGLARLQPGFLPCRFDAVARTSAGELQFRVLSVPNARIVIEVSDDMVSWESVWAFTNTGGETQFWDPATATRSHRFYRAVRVE